MEGWIKINFDGLVAQNRKASCGGLLCHSQGEFLVRLSTNLGMCLISVVEIWGAYYRLFLAWDNGYRKVMLELDSSSAIALIHSDFNPHHPYASVIGYVKHLLKREWIVEIKHTFRQANKVADHLAMLGHVAQLEVCFYEYPPADLASFLRDDAVVFLFLG